MKDKLLTAIAQIDKDLVAYSNPSSMCSNQDYNTQYSMTDTITTTITSSLSTNTELNNNNDSTVSNTNQTNKSKDTLEPLEPVEPFTMLHMDEYDTGDILLFSDKTFVPSLIIEYVCGSKFSHIGMILKDPVYIKPELTGLYILESTGVSHICDVEDNKIKTGAQIRKLEDVCKDYAGAIFWRKLHVTRDATFYKTITEVHEIIHNTPYDFNPREWLEGLFNIKLGDVQLTSRFFCSAMISYIYHQLELLDKDTPWSIIRPKDWGTEFDDATPSRFFAADKSRLNIINCTLDKEMMVRSYELYLHYLYRTY